MRAVDFRAGQNFGDAQGTWLGSAWSANKKLTIHSDDFWFARRSPTTANPIREQNLLSHFHGDHRPRQLRIPCVFCIHFCGVVSDAAPQRGIVASLRFSTRSYTAKLSV